MTSTSPPLVLGIDGCPTGWVAAAAEAGELSSLHHYLSIAELVEAHPEATAFGIDIPLWFPAGKEPRPSDPAARKLLGRRGSSVFAVPPRDVLEAPSFEEANELSKVRYERGISKQSYALAPKILEAVRFVESSGEERLFEVHPELSFRFLAESQGKQVASSKKTWLGFSERLAALESAGFGPPLRPNGNLGKAAPDDVLDACVAGWSANRISLGTAELVGIADNSALPTRPGAHPPVIYA